MISSIKIENVKGYSSPPTELDLNLELKKLNLIIAPNGFGKTSLVTAFKSLKPKSLSVEDQNKYKKNAELKSSLSITVDGKTLVANSTGNSISGNLFTYVINSKLAPAATTQSYGDITNTKSFLDIETIQVMKVVSRCSCKYNYTGTKEKFGSNGKILQNLNSYLSNLGNLKKIVSCFPYFEKYKAKSRLNKLDKIKSVINELKGNETKIKSNINSTLFNEIKAESYYTAAISHLNSENTNSDLENFLLFIQLLDYYNLDHQNIKDCLNRQTYLSTKKNIEETIDELNKTWKKITVSETKGFLTVSYPHADEISNGQRDILTFVVQLIKFKSIRPDKLSLLLIDEIFDYLDDANMLAAQYYVSQFMNDGRTYTVILTHLNPENFYCRIFNKNKLNINVLSKIEQRSSLSMKAFIVFRETLNRKDENDSSLYNNLSHYFFHYAPDTIDVSDKMPTKSNLKKNWAKDLNLHDYLIEQCNKYFQGNNEYDPYAICIALRMRIEKRIYEELNSEENKKAFIAQFETNKKLDLAVEKGVNVPDSFYLLSPIYNDANHLSNENLKKFCVLKLQHPVIRNFIKSIFEYKETPLDVSCIH